MLARHLGQIVNSLAFQRSIIGLILLAAVVVGLETSPAIVQRWGPVLHTLDWLIIWAFALEALMKMGQYGRRPHRYFHDPWNCFDFTIVVLCFLPATGQFAAVMRLARVLRVLRLITAVPRLQLLVSSLLRGLPSMGYVGLLLLLLFYVYGVMGVFLFRENDPFHFADLPRALLTLLGVVTLDNWDDVFYPQLFGSDVHPAPGDRVGPGPTAQPVVAVLYFVSFVLVGTIIMLNLVIGVILSSMQEAQTERDREELAASRAKDHNITADEELAYLEHQLDDLKRHIHVARAQLERERREQAVRLADAEQGPGPPDVDDPVVSH